MTSIDLETSIEADEIYRMKERLVESYKELLKVLGSINDIKCSLNLLMNTLEDDLKQLENASNNVEFIKDQFEDSFNEILENR